MDHPPEKQEAFELHSRLFSLRDALLDVSQALRDLHYLMDDEDRQQAEKRTDSLLKNLMKP